MHRLFLLSFLFIANLSFQSQAATCTASEFVKKTRGCQDARGTSIRDCNRDKNILTNEERAYAEEQLSLAFERTIPEMQEWLCSMTHVVLALRTRSPVMAVRDEQNGNTYLVYDASIVKKKWGLEYVPYFDFSNWTRDMQFGRYPNLLPPDYVPPGEEENNYQYMSMSDLEPGGTALLHKDFLSKQSPGFQFLVTPRDTWPLLMFLAGHEFGHHLEATKQADIFNSKGDFKDSLAALSFREEKLENGRSFYRLLDPEMDEFLLRGARSLVRLEDMHLVEGHFRRFLNSEFASVYASTSPVEDFCEVVAFYVLLKTRGQAGAGQFSVVFSSGERISLLDRIRRPVPKLKQKLDFLEKALATLPKGG